MKLLSTIIIIFFVASPAFAFSLIPEEINLNDTLPQGILSCDNESDFFSLFIEGLGTGISVQCSTFENPHYLISFPDDVYNAIFNGSDIPFVSLNNWVLIYSLASGANFAFNATIENARGDASYIGEIDVSLVYIVGTGFRLVGQERVGDTGTELSANVATAIDSIQVVLALVVGLSITFFVLYNIIGLIYPKGYKDDDKWS